MDLAREHGDELVIAYGVAPPGGVGEEWKANRAALEDQARAHTAEALAAAEQAGLTASVELVPERPAAALVEVADARDARFIVVGTLGGEPDQGSDPGLHPPQAPAPLRPPRCGGAGTLIAVPRMLKEFREFILRGNLVDLAIAVVIGTAFGAVVAALVADLVTPLIAAVGGEPTSTGSPSRSTAASSATATSSTRCSPS